MKFIAVFSLIATLTFSNAHALVVSDPGAYSRMSQQIQEAQKVFAEVQKQLQEMQRIQKNLSGNFSRGIGAERDIRKIKAILSDILPSFYNLTLPDGTKLDKNSTEDIVKAIDSIFISSNRHPSQAGVTENQRKVYSQRAVKSSLAYSEAIVADMENILAKLEGLAKQINETQTLKDSQDLTNRYLQEILTGQTKVILLLAQMSRAQAALSYKGVNNDEKGKLRPVTSEEYLDLLGKRGSKYWKPRPEAEDLMNELMGIE